MGKHGRITSNTGTIKAMPFKLAAMVKDHTRTINRKWAEPRTNGCYIKRVHLLARMAKRCIMNNFVSNALKYLFVTHTLTSSRAMLNKLPLCLVFVSRVHM